jgi:tRNA-specific 2-thiouridylase
VLRKEKIVVALSGGVDSSVAAALLVEQGHEVLGVSLRMWEENRGPRVCSDHRGAEQVAEHLEIPHELIDLRAKFVDTVVKPFAGAYLHGRTPNPCVACNRDFKLGTLLAWARQQGADCVATGHYARVQQDEVTSRAKLSRGVDRTKDQSYFLFALSQEQLTHTIFPLGGLHKSDVREKARSLGLPAAERPESQDICFGDYKALVASHAGDEELGAGVVVDRAGNVLGTHRGIHSVTIGQRHGLGIAASEPLYVLEIDAASKRIIVGKKDELGCQGLRARDVNWIAPNVEDRMTAQVQIRYRAPAVPCIIETSNDGRAQVHFEDSFPAVTPGQAAVFYRGDEVLGGGWIEQALR